MRLLVCGNRDWIDSSEISFHLALIFGTERDRLVIHGNDGDLLAKPPRGADKIAGWCAAGVGAAVDVYAVDHRIDGPWPGAGPRRNLRMFRSSKPDQGLAFGALWRRSGHPNVEAVVGSKLWKPSGTGNMVSIMLRAGVPVRWVSEPGAQYIDLVEMPEAPR